MATAARRKPNRFRLRPLEVADVPTIACWYEEVEDLAMFHSRMPLPLSAAAIEEGWRRAILSPEPRTSYWFTLVDEHADLAGFGGIEEVNYAHGTALAPFFIARNARRKGLAVRLRALLLDLAFDQLALARITSIHRADNVGSRRVNEACGFREEGRLRRAWRAGGEAVDVMIFGLLAEEWREHRVAMRNGLDPSTVVTLGSDPSGRWSWPGIAADE
jgi:RimJ/RimL family protein N-acetyltransferase